MLSTIWTTTAQEEKIQMHVYKKWKLKTFKARQNRVGKDFNCWLSVPG